MGFSQLRSQEPEWTTLFDGQSMENWTSTEFGGEGEVLIKEGALILEQGVELTGVNYQKQTPEQITKSRWMPCEWRGAISLWLYVPGQSVPLHFNFRWLGWRSLWSFEHRWDGCC